MANNTHNHNLEMMKQIILNEQLGNPKGLKLIIVENSLSDEDKFHIKQAVLKSASLRTEVSPLDLTDNLLKAFKLIEQY